MDRQSVVKVLHLVAGGKRHANLTQESITEKGRCAQLVRENTENGLETGVGNWRVAQKAFEFMRARGGSVRWASDYEKAALALGLEYAGDDKREGDVGYWPYEAADGNKYGHTAHRIVLASKWCWLENTDARNRPGGVRPFGAGTAIWVTPEHVLGAPSSIVAVSAEALENNAPASLIRLFDPVSNTQVGVASRVGVDKGYIHWDKSELILKRS